MKGFKRKITSRNRVTGHVQILCCKCSPTEHPQGMSLVKEDLHYPGKSLSPGSWAGVSASANLLLQIRQMLRFPGAKFLLLARKRRGSQERKIKA